MWPPLSQFRDGIGLGKGEMVLVTGGCGSGKSEVCGCVWLCVCCGCVCVVAVCVCVCVCVWLRARFDSLVTVNDIPSLVQLALHVAYRCVLPAECGGAASNAVYFDCGASPSWVVVPHLPPALALNHHAMPLCVCVDSRLDIKRAASVVHAALLRGGVHIPAATDDNPFPMHDAVCNVLDRLQVVHCRSSFQLMMNLTVLEAQLRKGTMFCGALAALLGCAL